MKKSKTIFFTIISVCLVCTLFVVCVYALLDSKSMSITNSFSFSPIAPKGEIKFDMNCICSGARETDVEVPGKTQDEYKRENNYLFPISYDNTNGQDESIPSWEIGNLTFKTESDIIYYRFVITNKSFLKGLRVIITQTSETNEYFRNDIYTLDSESSSTPINVNYVEIEKATQGLDNSYSYETKVIVVETRCSQAVNFTKENNFSLVFEAMD